MNDQTERYLREMFGTARGYVAMAMKRGTDWQEKVFAWPRERGALESWVDSHADGNVFICPALRGSRKRQKGDGVHLRWLWADVDWDKVPESRRARVRAAIDKVGTRVVSSGTGDNAHVYVKLTQAVTPEEHMRLNTGLRNLLYADAKHADNSLLRLPGTVNRKPGVGTPVTYRSGIKAVARNPSSLARVREFAAVTLSTPATGGTAVPWSKVDVSHVSKGLLRKTRMSEDEAKGRFNGKRHAAVWGVVGDLFSAGLTDDEIHTVMDTFPAALAKADDEHDGYDVHADVDRRLSTLRHAQAIVDGTDDHTTHADDDNPFEELSEDELTSLGPTHPMVKKELDRRAAMAEVENILAERRFIAPPDSVSWSAADGLANPPDPQRYLIDGIAGIKHNIVLTAQYKTGKTAFTIATLAKALCDGEPFAGSKDVPKEGRVVGHWNCEMEGNELLDDYIRPAGIVNADRLHVANLRGYGINILSPIGKAWAVEWLRSRNVQVWSIDSLARLLRMAGANENDNGEVLNVLLAVDEVKIQAGVDVSFIIAHTGRAEMEEGKERARGAASIDEWCDARWIMTKDGDTRFLMVEGRGVAMKTTSLVFNEVTKHSKLGGEDKASVRESRGIQMVATIVNEKPGVLKGELEKLVKERAACGLQLAREWITDAVECGFVDVKREKSPTGGQPRQRHYPAGRSGGGGATPRPVNMRNAGKQPRAR